MAHHLIYLPALADPTDMPPAERLAAVGLANHAAGFDTMRLEEGPDGSPGGLLLGWLTPTDNVFAYRPHEQTWRPSVPSGDRQAGAYWLGVWKDRRPREEELRLPYTHAGTYHQMGEEHWKIPRPEEVESTIRLNDDGSLRYEPMRGMSWFVDDCAKRKAALKIGDPNADGKREVRWTQDNGELHAWMCRVLMLNYRLTPELAGDLDLLTTRTLPALYMRALGILIEEAGGDG